MVVTAALVGRAREVTLALANFGICGLGVEVSGFAIAPTAPRLRTPPTTTPILTLPLAPSTAQQAASSPWSWGFGTAGAAAGGR